MVRCHDLIGGCEALEIEIGIKQNTATAMQAALDAAQAALAEVASSKKHRADCREELRLSDKEGERVIALCRLRLAAIFGNNYSLEWEAAGFPARSTQVPEVQAQRLTLLEHLAHYFLLKPEYQSADMAATASVCQATHDALAAARHGVNHAGALLQAAVKAKNAALLALRGRMRSLITELWILLPKDDARWQRFGLNIPAKDSMPTPVGSVTASAIGNGKVMVQWPAAPHATRYRVQTREIGTSEFTAVMTVHEREALLQEQTPGQFLEIRVISANSVDEAAASPSVMVAVG